MKHTQHLSLLVSFGEYYNKHNKLSKVQYFNSSNKMLYLETFSYSSAQLLKEYSIYGSDGNLWYKYFDFKYDERNYISQYKKLSNIIRTDCKLIKIIYDANGNIISETTCIDNGDSESMIFNNNGNPTKSNLVLVTKAAKDAPFNLEELKPLKNLKLKDILR